MGPAIELGKLKDRVMILRVNTGGSVAGSASNWKVISPGIETYQSPLTLTNIFYTWSLGQAPLLHMTIQNTLEMGLVKTE